MTRRKPEISLLQADPAFERLDVADPRLGLDQRGEPRRVDDRVGAPPVSFDRHRHLGPHSNGRRQPTSKSFEQRHVSLVADRIPGWMEGHVELEPQDSGHPSGQLDGELVGFTALGPADLRM